MTDPVRNRSREPSIGAPAQHAPLSDTDCDTLLSLVTTACDVPIAAIVSAEGESIQLRTTGNLAIPRGVSSDPLFRLVSDGGAVIGIGDTRRDARTQALSLVTDAPHIRSISGAPIVDSNGTVRGTIWALDTKPHAHPRGRQRILTAIARQAGNVLELECCQRTIQVSRLRADIAASFSLAGLADIDLRIDEALAEAGRFAGADRAYLFLVDGGSGTAHNTHEWCAPGIQPRHRGVPQLPRRMYAFFLDSLRQMQPVIWPDIEAIPQDSAVVRAQLQAQQVRSLGCAGIYRGDDLVGFAGFESVREPRHWGAAECELLSGVGDLCYTALCRLELLRTRRTEQARIDAIQDQTPGLRVIADFNGYFQSLSPDWSELLGYSVAELRSEPFITFVHPDDVDATMHQVRQLMNGGHRTIAFENRYRCKNGHYVWLSWHATSDPEQELLIASVEDIDRRKRSQAQGDSDLRKARQRLRGKEEELLQFLEVLRHGVLVIDGAGAAYYANQRLYRMAGLPVDAPLATLWKGIRFRRQNNNGDAVPIDAATLLAEDLRAEDVELLTDTSSITVAVSTSRIRDTNGRIVNTVATVEDRTDALAMTAQLHQAQKMESIGRLAGGVAHDFNNMLTAIMAFGHFAREQLPAPHPARADMDEMLAAAGRAEELTKQLLAFSRKKQLRPQTFDLTDSVAAIGRMLQRMLGDNIELRIDDDGTALPVQADPAAIEQVIVNLAINARDAMPDGGKIMIHTARVTEEDVRGLPCDGRANEFVLLTVRDSGIGMDSETMERVFEPFFSTKPATHGTGLGLSTSYGIIKQTGGDIWARSTAGVGTTFYICLPLNTDQPAVDTSRSVFAAATHGDETVLIVEDDQQVLNLASRSLSRLGYRVLHARGADEAIALFNEHSGFIDLIVSDIVMPGKSGRAMIAELRQSFLALPPVLHISGYNEERIDPQALAAENTFLLPKPFTPEQFAAAARQALDSHKPASDTPPAAHHVLIIDDESHVCRAATRLLVDRGFVTTCVSDVATARNAIANRADIDIVLLDLALPDMRGDDFHGWLSEHHPGLANCTILMSGDIDAVGKTAASSAQLLAKPFTSESLLQAVTHATP